MTYSTFTKPVASKPLTLESMMADMRKALDRINTPPKKQELPLSGFPGELRIHINPILSKEVLIKMCRSKKKRIRKKWLKNPRNYKTVPDDNIYILNPGAVGIHPMDQGEFIVAHPLTAQILKTRLALENFRLANGRRLKWQTVYRK